MFLRDKAALGKETGRKKKKNEIMPFAAMWTDLKNITLSEISQTEKDKYSMTSLIRGI